jgi:hypothetical protein
MRAISEDHQKEGTWVIYQCTNGKMNYGKGCGNESIFEPK